MKPTTPGHTAIVAPREKREVWEQFRADKELLDRLSVTHDELKALENCALLGTLSGKDDLLFILRQLREPRTGVQPDAPPAPRPGIEVSIDDEPEDPAPRFAPPLNLRTMTNLRDPASFESIARNRRLEHLGIFAGALGLIAIVMWNFLGGISAWRDHFLSIVPSPAGQQAVAAAQSNPGGSLSKLVVAEIFALGVIALVMHLRSRKGHRRFKVKPY
ncbi:MAG TPA: hypothetical protein VEU51_17195 [Candidatus Acidoferrales bacterium]|nr:hypothetical protein [Candidatus Acidoferrales bacterium]